MSRIFITGAADGLGQLTAKALLEQGHQVVLHARNKSRAADALKHNPGAAAVLTADLLDLEETKALADQVNALGPFDAVVHNAGIYRASAAEIFAVNTLAPYVLTCLIRKPGRLVYVSSDMHLQGHARLNRIEDITYSDSKLHVLMLCKAVADQWPGVYANALHPGWVPTKMGGASAPDSLTGGFETQVWLAASDEPGACVTGQYFFHKRIHRYNPEADNKAARQKLLERCADLTGVTLESH